MSKVIGSFTEAQKEQVHKLMEECLTNEIDKLTFTKDHFARFLKSTGFNTEKAASKFSDMLVWRKETHVNGITESEANDEVEEDIKNYLPHGWHHTDKQNHPIFYVHLGESQIKSLMT